MKYEFTIRDLYYKVLDYKGEKLFTDLLKPWVENHNYKRFIKSVTDSLNISNEKSCELYALSRLLDILTLHFLPNNNADGSDWLGVDISKNEYIEFINIIGLETVKPKAYDTFHANQGLRNRIKNKFKLLNFNALNLFVLLIFSILISNSTKLFWIQNSIIGKTS